MAYTITWEPGGPWIRCTGPLTDADLLEVSETVLTHPEYPSFSHYVLDARQADLSPVSSEGIERLAQLHTRARETNPALYGIGISDTVLARGLAGSYMNWREALGGGCDFELLPEESAARMRVTAIRDERRHPET